MPSIEQIEPIFHEATLLAENVDRDAWLARRMSSVYLAERVDGRFDKQVAVKVMAAHLVAGEEFLRRLRTEAQFLATLQHPNIPSLLDSGVSPSGHPYLVVEYVEGEALDHYCDQRKPGIDARLRLFLQVCQAVDHAHRTLILHRDLKPSNIAPAPTM